MRNDLHTLITANELDINSPIFEEVILYLLRAYGTPIKVYHQRFAKACSFHSELTPARFRTELHDTEYVGVALKFFAGYAALKYGKVSTRHLTATAPKYGVSKCDAKRVIAMLGQRHYLNAVRSRLVDEGFTAESLDLNAYREALQLGHNVIVGLTDSIAKHVNRNLRWVAKAHNCRTADLNTEITAQVISVYYSILPTHKSDDHVQNYLCSALHSRIKNLANYHSAEKRKRQVKVVENGETRYSLIEASESHLNKFSAGGDSAVSIEEMGGCDDSLELHNFEFTRSVDALFKIAKCKPKRFALYSVLLGRNVPAFAEFLRQKRLLRSETKTVREWLIDKPVAYLAEVLGKWLGVSPAHVQKGMTEMAMILL